jgi:hypothetical protein
MKNIVIGTSLNFFFANPRQACPRNPLYGAKVKGFGSSIIHQFGQEAGEGKLWQLRSVQVGKTKDWFILPFVINTGGSPWNKPIISEQSKNIIGLNEIHHKESQNQSQILRMPTPLGIIPAPLSQDWDCYGRNAIQSDDVRFNLVGQELAHIIGTINDDLDLFNVSAEIRHILVDTLVKRYEHLGVKDMRKFIEMEFDAMNASQRSGKSWDSDTLPFDDSFFE